MLKSILSVILMAVVCTVYSQNGFQSAIVANDAHTVKQLAKSGQDLNAPFVSEGMTITPLAFAAVRADADMVSLLIKSGADVKKLVNGQDALMFAAKGGNKECVNLLLNSGANVLNENKEGRTARDIAVNAGHTDVALILENAMKVITDNAKAKKAKK